jgi:hypothetical protein
MLAFFHSLALSATHIDIAQLLIGTWYINSTIFPNQSTIPLTQSSILKFGGSFPVLRGNFSSPFNSINSIVLTFTGKGIFVANDGDSDQKLGEFEFFDTLMPHLTAVGQWKTDSIFSANVISPDSLHLSIVRKESSAFFVFSKDVPKQEKSFFERHMLLFLTGVLFLIRYAKGEFDRREKQLRAQRISQAETARFEKMQEEGKEFEEKGDQH